MAAPGFAEFREREFITQNLGALYGILGAVNIIMDPRIEGGLRPDLIAILGDGRTAIIEIKLVTPNTQPRLERVVNQLRTYGQAWEGSNPGSEPVLVLVVPNALSIEHIAFLTENGVDRIIDGPALQAAPDVRFVADADHLTIAESADQPGPAKESLLQDLGSARPGKEDWSLFQRLTGDILSYLFHPPLERPIPESPNTTKHNRRDFILPNYAPDSFWAFMRGSYRADYIVVDAKNLTRKVKKNEILQLANYLSSHGAGLFGMIVSRNGSDPSALITQREQWAFHNKMIIVLDDDDTKQMITLRASDDDPASLIQQKIEDFRLGF